MPDNGGKKYLVLAFTIPNRQRDYARVTELILAIESLEGLESFLSDSNSRYFSDIMTRTELKENLVSANLDNTWFGRWFSENRDTQEQKIKFEKFIETLKSLNGENSEYVFYYQFKIINKEDNDVAEFFYYCLILQHPKFPQSRTFALIEPQDIGDIVATNSNYFRFSRFSMLLPAFYRNSFAPFCRINNNEKEYHIVRLSKKGESDSFFPLLEITEKEYIRLRRRWKFVEREANPGRNRSKLKSRIVNIVPDGCSNDKLAIQLCRFANYNIASILDKTHEGIGGTQAESIMKTLLEVISEDNGITLLQYVFFSIKLIEFKEFVEKSSGWARACLDSAMILSYAITQLLENIVFHSINKKGLFAIRVHDVDSRHLYLESLFPEIAKKKGRVMQIMIADFNQDKNIIDTFLGNAGGKAPREFEEYREAIQLSDLFGEYAYGHAEEVWEKFRGSKLGNCLGLPVFAKSMEQLSGIVNARSSTKFQDDSMSILWRKDFATPNDATDSVVDALPCIPGTQIITVLSLVSSVQQLVPLAINSNMHMQDSPFAESFEGFSLYLDYEARKIDVEDVLSHIDSLQKDFGSIYTQESKDKIVKKFKDYWSSKYSVEQEQNVVFVVDLNNFCKIKDEYYYEPFCKGLFCSDWFSGKVKIFLMLVNCSRFFSLCFYSTLISDKNNISNNNTQICLYETNGARLPIVGGSPSAVEWNIQKYYQNIGGGIFFPHRKLFGEEAEKNESFPFDLFALENGSTAYERNMKRIATHKLLPENNDDSFGFCLNDTHMRLGNKVHIDTFYEMAPYFLRQEVAKQSAFFLLKRLLREEEFKKALNLENSEICFYGYAGYSRAIVSTMATILTRYINNMENKKKAPSVNYKARVSFAIFQTKQTGEAVENNEQIYYSGVFLGSAKERQEQELDLSIIQIVPISSTLTTFKKMWYTLLQSKRFNTEKIQSKKPLINQTIFWVRNTPLLGSENSPTSIEQKYWHDVDLNKRVIMTVDDIIQEPTYVLAGEGQWSDPLSCQKCFPKDVLDEYLLVETDDSSTIPSQQYYRPEDLDEGCRKKNEDRKKNEERVAKLQDFLKYGHIVRGGNHFQYYLDAQEFFHAYRDEIQDWIGSLARTLEEDDFFKDNYIVIVSPQRSDNIEFAQYINNYCFDGRATLLNIDSEKHFRSNLEAEYHDYIVRIKTIIGKEDPKLLRFIYVDTSISTGRTYNRINSLMNSIVPENNNSVFSFNKIFVLIDRLSSKSQKAYVVNQNDNFHAFVHLAISNLRTYGDSCICCKLKANAEHFYKLAATKKMSEYWEEKIYKNHEVRYDLWGKALNSEGEPVNLDSSATAMLKNKKEEQRLKGFLRMICAHRFGLKLKTERGRESSSYFDVLKAVFNEVMILDNKLSSYSGPICQDHQSKDLRKTASVFSCSFSPHAAK